MCTSQRPVLALALGLALGPASPLLAGDGTPRAEAVLAQQAPVIDGHFDDAVWQVAPRSGDFIAMLPVEDVPARYPTFFQVAWDRANVYVAIYARDPEPDKIAARLHRRDEDSESDWLFVSIDGYHDHRTGRTFGVNAAGVQADMSVSNDNYEDRNWDAVWDSAVRVGEDGWYVEMRIPLSALRFTRAPSAEWGFQISRYVSREKELSWWARESQRDARLVSRYGHLVGVSTEDPPARASVAPYGVAGAYVDTHSEEAPLVDSLLRAGADLQYGVTSNITLDVTLNPDFGQVELDPAQLNLTAFETFYPEKRPFFLEGADIFNAVGSFGDGEESGTRFYYSRRIGQQSDILTAAKLTGRTEKGLSVGVVEAVTGVVGEEDVASNYAAARVKQEFGARNYAGAIVTAVNRAGDARDAYVGAGDFVVATEDGTWGLGGVVSGSSVTTPPDESGVVDTSQGLMARGIASKDTGEHIVGAVSYGVATPEFSVNDMGYMRKVGEHGGWTWVQLRHLEEVGPLRNFRINTNTWYGRLLEEDLLAYGGGNANINVNFKSYAFAYLGGGMDVASYDIYEPRIDGFVYHRPQSGFVFSGFGTDPRRVVRGAVEMSAAQSVVDEQSVSVNPEVAFRVGDRGNFGVGLNVGGTNDEWGFADAVNPEDETQNCREDQTGCQPVFGRRDVAHYGLASEGMFTFRPDLSLQYFAQLFMFTVDYSDFASLTPEGDVGDLAVNYTANPSFDYEQFDAKFVLRWEYNPGSTLYAVWTHQRQFGGGQPDLSLGELAGQTFTNGADNTFLVKASYRWGSDTPNYNLKIVKWFQQRGEEQSARGEGPTLTRISSK